MPPVCCRGACPWPLWPEERSALLLLDPEIQGAAQIMEDHLYGPGPGDADAAQGIPVCRQISAIYFNFGRVEQDQLRRPSRDGARLIDLGSRSGIEPEVVDGGGEILDPRRLELEIVRHAVDLGLVRTERIGAAAAAD